MTIAEAIAHYAQQLGPTMFRTTYRTLEVPGVWRNGQVVFGRLDPSRQLDPSSVQAESDSYVRRYGPGAGTPYKRDTTVGQAISVIPDHDHALKGGGLEEGTYFPAEKALALLGITSLSWQDKVDLTFCVDFNDAVIRCTDLGIPLGTPRSQWPQPPAWVSPAPPPNSTPVRTPFDSSNQGVGKAGAQSNVQQQSAPPPLAALSLPDLQNLIAQSVAQAIGQAVPVLIQAEIGRLVPTSPTSPTSVSSLPTGTPGPTPIPAEVVAPAGTTVTAMLKAQLAAANQTLASINDALRGVPISPRGGGAPMNALRKIANIMQGT